MILGLDLGGTKLLAGWLDDDGGLISTRRWPTGRDLTPARFMTLLREAAVSGERPRAVGIGFPGLVDAGRGVVRSSVMLDGWADVPLAALAAEALGVPVRVDNDVNMAARAEARVRRHRGERADDFVMITLGTGIGGALVLGGHLYGGATGLAGEIGHVAAGDGRGPPCRCGRSGCLGALAAGAAFSEGLDGPRAASALDALGSGLASVINVLNPALLVVGGGVPAAHAALVPRLAARVRALAMPEIAAACRIEAAVAGAEAGTWGAGLLALEAAR